MTDLEPKPLDPYEALPEYVRAQVTKEEWLWLSDARKATLESDLTEPEA